MTTKKLARVFGLILVIALVLFLPRAPLGEVYADPPSPTIPPGADIGTLIQLYAVRDLEPSLCNDCELSIDDSPQSPAGIEDSVGILATETFNSIADATVIQALPGNNFGNTSDMWAGYDVCHDPNQRIVRSLVKFNTSSLPADQKITKGTLKVMLNGSCGYTGQTVTIRTHRITGSWSEGGVNWNNKPGYSSASARSAGSETRQTTFVVGDSEATRSRKRRG